MRSSQKKPEYSKPRSPQPETKTSFHKVFQDFSVCQSVSRRDPDSIYPALATLRAAPTSATTARQDDFDADICEDCHAIDFEPAGVHLGLGSGTPDYVEHTRCADARSVA